MRSRSLYRVVLAGMLGLLGPRATHAQEGWLPTAAALSAPFVDNLGTLATAQGGDAAGNVVALFVTMGPNTTRILEWNHLDAATGQWSAPARLSAPGVSAVSDVALAVSPAGDALAVWQQYPTYGLSQSEIVAARYSAATRAWSPAVQLSLDGVSPAVASNAQGLAIAVWREVSNAFVRARTVDLASNTWGSVREIATPGSGYQPAVALDGTGAATVIWMTQVYGPVVGLRLDTSTGVWGPVSTVLPVADGMSPPRLAMNPAGHAAAMVGISGTVLGATADAAGTWTAARTLSSGGYGSQAVAPAVDAAGNVFMAWAHYTLPSTRVIRVQRYDAGLAAWEPVLEAGNSGEAFDAPALAVDAGGNAWLAWSRAERYSSRILGVRFVASLGTWTPASDLTPPPGPYETTAEGRPRLSMDAAGNTTLTYLWWQYNDSVWKAARWRATPPAPAPGDVVPAPGALQIAGTLAAASDPALAVTNLEYSLDDGATWTARSPASPLLPLTVTGLTDGVTYDVRVRAVNAAGAGAPSPLLRARSGADVVPMHLRIVSRSGPRTTFAWTAPPAGLVPTDYLIEGGLAGQTQVLAGVPVGGAATQATLDLPAGAFFVRVAGLWHGRRLATSLPLIVTTTTAASPSPPVDALGTAAGSALALSWRNTWEGAAPTAVRLTVSGSLAGVLDLPLAEAFTFPNVPPGTYTFSVTTTAGGVASAPSSPVTLSFPGTCPGAPQPPTALSASTRGGTVYLDWLPPASGEAATSFLVSVTGTFAGVFPVASRTLSAPAPPGSYTIRVVSVGLCGTSVPTAAQTVVVP